MSGLFQQSEATAANSTVHVVIMEEDGVTPYTGSFAAGDIKVSKAGAAYGNINCVPSHLESGDWIFPLTATDTNTVGDLTTKVEKNGVQTIVVKLGTVVPWDPYSTTNLGLSNITDIKAKTDNLPSDPADASVIAAAFAVTDAQVALVKAKTDNIPTDPADASDVAAATAAIQADTDNIQSRLPASLVGGRMDSNVQAMANNVMTAAALATDAVTEIVDAIFAKVIEGTITFLQAARIKLGSAAGETSGYDSGTPGTVLIKSIDGSKTRVTINTDATGRTASTPGDLT